MIRSESSSALLLILCFTGHISCERISTKIYENLNADSFCFKQLNATHQIGCTSSVSGNVGVVHVVESSEDMRWILAEGPDPPYIAALSYKFFNLGNMTELKQSNRVTGVLVLQGNVTAIEEGYSPDKACPNEGFGLYDLYKSENPKYAVCDRNQEWNPPNLARTMHYQDWGMPIFLVTQDHDVQSIVQGCYNKFNAPVNGTARPWPLCSAEVGSYMLAAKDSPTCMRRSNMNKNMMTPVKLCDPLGSFNVITTLFPTDKRNPHKDRSVIIVAARLDAASMFDRVSPGVGSSVTGLVTLLSVAHTLSRVNWTEINPKKAVLFVVFNGESFDYIGSSRVVYDMEQDSFPQKLEDDKVQPALVKLEHISHFIELNQLGPQRGSRDYWIHTDPISNNNTDVKQNVENTIQLLKKYSSSYKFNRTDESYPLPPASVQRFLRKDINIPSIVITNFDKQFNNKHYNSRFDLQADLDDDWEAYLQELSAVVSKTVYELLVGDEPRIDLNTNATLISQIMDCYSNNSLCELFQLIAEPSRVQQMDTNTTDPLPLYVSVNNYGNVNPVTMYTEHLLSYLTGEQVQDYTASNCSDNKSDLIYHYNWVVGNLSNPGICIRSLVGHTLAVSPAAELDDWTSTEYSTWTESVWHTTSLRIFLRPSRQLEGLTLGIGCIIFVFSLVIVYSANKRAELLFGTRGLIGC